MSPDQKGIETFRKTYLRERVQFTMSPDQKGIETGNVELVHGSLPFTMSPDQKGIETSINSKSPSGECSQ